MAFATPPTSRRLSPQAQVSSATNSFQGNGRHVAIETETLAEANGVTELARDIPSASADPAPRLPVTSV